jgi:hypothetical protein
LASLSAVASADEKSALMSFALMRRRRKSVQIEFAERRRVLGEAAGLTQFPSEAAVRVIDELGNRTWDVVEVATPAVDIIGMAPAAIIKHHPER